MAARGEVGRLAQASQGELEVVEHFPSDGAAYHKG